MGATVQPLMNISGHRSATASVDVAVHAVVGDVELAVGEPLRERCLRPVEDLGEGFRPRQALGLGRPERQAVSFGLVVEGG
ncbi:hypothetical protein EB75_26010 [Mycobacterium sp. ST-F2]|uniref:Uncharacterized protein n=1 Tax=Mycolicibacterium mucogenicum TaxID=56689 RepID=A0A1A0N1G7_MYCMU|nr:hypothetical protein A5642_10325 [Mycolicibacterium mucogenicum]OKH78898.1 hypothetical protein EB75_26010 [Mycobacterium sp. ST-F2]